MSDTVTTNRKNFVPKVKENKGGGRPKKGKFGKGKAPLTRELYNALLAYYRDNGPNSYAAAGRYAGCHTNTAKRAWEKGWPNRAVPFHPISEVLHAEGVKARAKRAQAIQELAKQEARQVIDVENDATETRMQEGMMVRDARTVAGKLLGQTVKMVQAAEVLAAAVILQVQAEMMGTNSDGKAKSSASAKLAIVERVQRFATNSALLAETAMNLERKFMGAPETIIGHAAMSVDEIVAELFAGQQDLEKLVGKQIIDVSPGADFSGSLSLVDEEDD